MVFLPVFIAYLVFRILDSAVSVIAPVFLPYIAFFPYRELLPESGLPQWLYSFANFDGLHYVIIADMGYQEYQQAFFPLFPMLIRMFAPLIGNNYLLTGILLATVLGLTGTYLFARYSLALLGSASATRWTLAFFLLFPTSFYLGALYTESLFLVCAVGYLWSIHSRRFALAGLFGLAAGATRLIGLFLVIPLAVMVLLDILAKLRTPKNFLPALFLRFRRAPALLLAFLGPFAGLAAYMLYLYVQTGDPLFFFNAQPAFGANRSTDLILLPRVVFRYLKIFTTADLSVQYFVAVLEFVLFSGVLGALSIELWKIAKGWKTPETAERIGVSLFGLASMTLPTLTGTLSSTPRYALMVLSVFFVLGTIRSILVKVILLIVSVVLHVVLLTLFLRGYFVG